MARIQNIHRRSDQSEEKTMRSMLPLSEKAQFQHRKIAPFLSLEPQDRLSQKNTWVFWQKTAAALTAIGLLVLIAKAFTPEASSSKIVTARLQGGTGNQLFQAAAACAHAKKIGGVCQFQKTPVNFVGESPVLDKLIRKNIQISKTIKKIIRS